MDTSNPYHRAIIALCALLASLIAGILIGVKLASAPPVPAGQWTPAKQDGRIADVGTTTVQPKDCKVVVAKPGAKEKLDLPTPIKADIRRHVTAAIIVNPNERPQSVVTIFDEITGQTETLTQRVAYPLLAAEHRGRFGLGAGYKSGQRVGHVYLGETVVQIKGWHGGGTLHLFTDRDYVVEAVLEYRW